MGESLILLLGARLYVVCFHYYTFSVFGVDVWCLCSDPCTAEEGGVKRDCSADRGKSENDVNDIVGSYGYPGLVRRFFRIPTRGDKGKYPDRYMGIGVCGYVFFDPEDGRPGSLLCSRDAGAPDGGDRIRTVGIRTFESE